MIRGDGVPDGGASSYYDLPPAARTLGHVIEGAGLTHAEGEIMCALYRRKPGVGPEYDARKVVWYAIENLFAKLFRASADGRNVDPGKIADDLVVQIQANRRRLIDQIASIDEARRAEAASSAATPCNETPMAEPCG